MGGIRDVRPFLLGTWAIASLGNEIRYRVISHLLVLTVCSGRTAVGLQDEHAGKVACADSAERNRSASPGPRRSSRPMARRPRRARASASARAGSSSRSSCSRSTSGRARARRRARAGPRPVQPVLPRPGAGRQRQGDHLEGHGDPGHVQEGDELRAARSRRRGSRPRSRRSRTRSRSRTLLEQKGVVVNAKPLDAARRLVGEPARSASARRSSSSACSFC